MSKALDKGAGCEERVRNYFLSLGMYAVRSVPCIYNETDITDIDIWLYTRPSPITRHRINVDIKFKKTPQAIERIFWSLGLRESFKLDECIVVTTDKRPDVYNFGKMVNVSVLDGNFLALLDEFDVSNKDIGRLTEEEFKNSIAPDKDQESHDGLYAEYFHGKRRLLNELNFNGVNAHLSCVVSRCEELAQKSSRREGLLRLLLIHISHLLITLDYFTKDIRFKQIDAIVDSMDSGFRYGTMGQWGLNRLLERNEGLIKKYAPESMAVSSKIRSAILSDYSNSSYSILSQYFSKPEVMNQLFDTAIMCEAIAFKSSISIDLNTYPTEIRAIIGLICDYMGMERSKIL